MNEPLVVLETYGISECARSNPSVPSNLRNPEIGANMDNETKANLFLNDVGFHIWDDSDGEFSDDGFGDDGFASRFGKGAFDTVQRERRMAPPVHQRLRFVFTVDQPRRSDVLIRRLKRKWDKRNLGVQYFRH